MTVRLLNPDNHVTIPLHHHVAIATGNTQIHLAGQVAVNENGALWTFAPVRRKSP